MARSAFKAGLTVENVEMRELMTHDREGAVHHGVLTESRAQLMAEMMVAAGDTSIRVTGSQASKETMARAAFKAGLTVENVEMRELMAEFAREQEHAQRRAADVAAMRPATPRAERPPQRPEQSAVALRDMEIGRLSMASLAWRLGLVFFTATPIP